MSVQPMIVTQQPMVVTVQSNRNYWQTNLCDCFSDCGVCFCGMFFFPCMACQVAADMNECCFCGPTVAMRAVYRTKYSIPGSICNDTCIVCCFPVCSLCQIKRDINRRKAMGIF
ncbi:placenta-specific gene 8 protein-like [Pantherophis guttatus]|uniref:Placenta-specific gene 8 protein-like n=1 Tax=Pantherophis guttatus TaxID=94885 RepID=A0A6P9D5X6_PANGU|nr:placenta-specific gene 8 protein-like [Pantherophis guttatus]XP_034287001.1 placenta-specific gene 8 protein-like [Pantherophis guttatus]